MGKTSDSPGRKGSPLRPYGRVKEEKRGGGEESSPVLAFDDCRMFLFKCPPSLQLQTELQRLEVLKMNSIKSFTETIRTEIALYWEKCFYSLEQREAFAPYHTGESSGVSVCDRRSESVGVSACRLFTDDFTEEVLNLHEAEVKTLEKYYEDHRELFDGVTKWQENWTLYLELDVSAHQLQQSVFNEPDGVTCALLCLEKKQRPFKVQQQRWEPSQRREAEN